MVAFLEKPICFFFPGSQSGRVGGKNGHLGSRESRARKNSKMLQEQLSWPEVFPFFRGGWASKRTKVWAGLGRDICAGAMF